ncbi:hypothetical protein [Actinomadura madurae]|uniref:hypothetical protein n=1 Tax=Actinomadura madurae TaxID=1993 RepID=UPI0027E22869|nr:hypothetical protein [Actinomadura madurae]
MSQPRSAGNPEIMSRPPATVSQSRSGESMPPGSRQAMPTIAIGSSAPDWSSSTRLRVR